MRKNSPVCSSRPTSLALIYAEKTWCRVLSWRNNVHFLHNTVNNRLIPGQVRTWIPFRPHYFQVSETHKTNIISALQCSNKHKYLIHTRYLSLHYYPGSAPTGKSGTILSHLHYWPGPGRHFRLFTVV